MKLKNLARECSPAPHSRRVPGDDSSGFIEKASQMEVEWGMRSAAELVATSRPDWRTPVGLYCGSIEDQRQRGDEETGRARLK
jgi:hypothetical protein